MTIREDLRKELVFLRTREGLVIGRFAGCRTLRGIVGPPGIKEGYDRFVSLLDQLGGGAYARAYRSALGLGWDDPGNSVEKRRQVFGDRQEPSRAVEAVQDWEDRGIDQLIDALLLDYAQRIPPPPDSGSAYLFAAGLAKELSSKAVAALDDGRNVLALKRGLPEVDSADWDEISTYFKYRGRWAFVGRIAGSAYFRGKAEAYLAINGELTEYVLEMTGQLDRYLEEHGGSVD